MHSIHNKYLILSLAVIVMTVLAGCRSSKSVARQQTHLSKAEINSSRHPATAKLLAEADSWIGTPYKYAGTDRSGIDCSALTLNVFKRALAISLPRNSAAQADWCRTVKRNEIIAGDLIFFSSNSSGNRIGHVGIYVGDGRIIHASPSKGVVLAPLDSRWFNDHYRKAGRVDPYYAMLGRQPDKKRKKTDKVPTDGRDRDIPLPQPTPSITLGQFIAANAVKVDTTASVSTETVADARTKVINTYRELPPDSVLTSYFE